MTLSKSFNNVKINTRVQHQNSITMFKVILLKYNIVLQLPVQSVPITTNVVSSNPVHGEVYSIQHYVIKFVSDLRQVGGFLQVLRFPPGTPVSSTNKTDHNDIAEILLTVALNTKNKNRT